MGLFDRALALENGLYTLRSSRARHTDDMHTFSVQDFRNPNPSVWNDGVGSASRDTDITHCGLPTLKLDTQGNSNAGATNPGRTAATSGVVVKHRTVDNFSGRFGLDCYFRFTSLNLTTNAFLSMSIYNRDGAQAFHGRVWLDPAGNNTPMHGRILDGTATALANPGAELTGNTAVYTDVVTSLNQNGGGSHLYDPTATSGRLDKAGGWHYVKLVIDMTTKKYVTLKLDGMPVVDLSGYSLDVTNSTGYAGMHMSHEFSRNTSTRGYVHIAQVRGYSD